METLKSLIPEHLLQTVKSSSTVLSSSSSLLRFLLDLPQFHQVSVTPKTPKTLTLSNFLIPLIGFSKAVSELSDPDLGCCGKSQESSLDLKRRGNLCFRTQKSFDDALRFYSKALRVAPLRSFDGDKSLLASLFLNRANALHVSQLSLTFEGFSSLLMVSYCLIESGAS